MSGGPQKVYTVCGNISNKKIAVYNIMNITVDLTHYLRRSFNTLYPTPQTKEMNCVEIGSFEGYGSCLIYDHLCNNQNSKLYCIDPFDDEYVKGNAQMSFWDHACKGQYMRFKSNTAHLSKLVELKGTSDNMIPLLEDNTIDFAYIDGDHSPEQVYKDAVNIFGKVKSNGIILFDDYLFEINGINTKLGIDNFLKEYTGKYKLLFQDYQLAIEKL